MILNIELENQKFLDLDFEDAIYITGPNQKQIWKVFRSLYYYFNKNPKLTSNVYGDNNIELLLDGNNLSVKNNDLFFVNNRDSIYDQMVYKKSSLLYELLNSLNDNMSISHAVESINDECLKLEIIMQELLNKNSDNLQAELLEISFLDILKSYLTMGYEESGMSYPLEFMDTETLLDEFLNFLEFKLKSSGRTTWLVLYNLESFISDKDQQQFLIRIKLMLSQYDLKLIYLSNELKCVPVDENDIEKIIISAEEFHQLLPYDELIKSIELRYPNELNIPINELIDSLKRIFKYIGSDKDNFISNRDLLLLKVMNEIVGYKTRYDLKHQLLSESEIKYLED